MKKKALLALVLALCLALTACGDAAASAENTLAEAGAALEAGRYEDAVKGFSAVLKVEPASIPAARGLVNAREALSGDEPEQTALPLLLEAYSALYAAGEFTADDYYRLARLYALSGDVPRQRDALERAVRLAPTQEGADTLFALVVNAEADREDVCARAKELAGALSAGDLDGAVALVRTPAWQETMMPSLTAGTRRYTLSPGDGAVLKIEVGYTGGVFVTRSWYAAPTGAVTVVRAGTDRVLCCAATLADGKYTGPYHMEACDGDTGDRRAADGTFTGDVCTGAYSESVFFGEGAGDAGALWPVRSQGEKTAYAGEFDSEGRALAQGQYAVSAAGGIVYAYDGAGTGYLCLYPAGDGTEGYVFTCRSWGVPAYPLWA